MKRRAGIYVRISQDRDGRALGVQRQEEDCAALCDRNGWAVVDIYRDNDVSASTGKRRPEYERLLDDIRAGRIDAVAVWALDRLYRRPIDLETLIPLVEAHGVRLATVGGDVDLSTRGGLLHARIMGAVAADEIRAKSDRAKRAQRQAAEQGRFRGGGRPFGYQDGGMRLNRREATVLAKCIREVLAGQPLGAQVRYLNERGITSSLGRPWNYTTLRQAMCRPRNAGLIEYQGEILGPAGWPAIVSEDEWRAVCVVLTDPGRRRSTSNRPKHLLAGLALCGVEVDGQRCGERLKSASATERRGGYRTVYRCRSGLHLAKTASYVDEFVEEVVIARLSQPDARNLANGGDVDLSPLHSEAEALRLRLDSLAEDFADGELTPRQLRVATERVRKRLDELEQEIAAQSRTRMLDDLLLSQDIAAAWRQLPLARKRGVIDLLMTVTVLPSPHRGARFGPEQVQIEWA